MKPTRIRIENKSRNKEDYLFYEVTKFDTVEWNGIEYDKIESKNDWFMFDPNGICCGTNLDVLKEYIELEWDGEKEPECISCKTFEKLMNEFIDYVQKEEKISEAFRALDDDFCNLYPSYWHDLFLKTISQSFPNPEIAEDWICHWCWECDYGKNQYADGVTTKEGKAIPFRTLKDLYNCILTQ